MAIEVYPVVHVHSPEQAAEQTSAAFSVGADGVYLINHSIDRSARDTLLKSYATARELQPARFICINILDSVSGLAV